MYSALTWFKTGYAHGLCEKIGHLGPKHMILAFFKSFTLPGESGIFPKYMFLHKDDVQRGMSDVLG